MPTTQTNPMVEEYVARCSVLLWDLSPKLQDQLRDDIRQIVGEVAMELDGQPDDLVGPPLRFVSELRVAAGLPQIPAAQRPSPEPPTPPAESAWLVVAGVILQLARTVKTSAWPWTRELALDLRPAWWVARGVGLAFVLGAITGWRPQALLPNLFDSQFLGLFSTAGMVIASVHLGRRGPTSRLKQLLWAAASVIGLLALVGFVGQSRYDDSYGYAEPYVEYQDAAFASPVLHQDAPFITTTIELPHLNNGLVNFIDPATGGLLGSASAEYAREVAANMPGRFGYTEYTVEHQGVQTQIAAADLYSYVVHITGG